MPPTPAAATPTQPRRWFYAAYLPYGPSALNTNGPRANVLHRFPRLQERDAWVARDPEHRERRSANDRKVRLLLLGDQWDGNELRFMD